LCAWRWSAECASLSIICRWQLTPPRVAADRGSGYRSGAAWLSASSSARNALDAGAERLRRISELLDAQPLLDSALLELLRRTAEYYTIPSRGDCRGAPAAAARGVSAAAQNSTQPDERRASRPWAAGSRGAHRASARCSSCWRMRRRGQRSQLDVLEPAAAPARGLQQRAGLNWPSAPILAPQPRPSHGLKSVAALTDAQAAAVTPLARRAPVLLLVLEGATGSGKTEVYLRATAEALARGERVLILVPKSA